MKKRLWCLLMGLLPFGLNADEMKVPFSVPVDFSKKGTVYETDFQAPWNIWGSLVEFGFGIFLSSKPSVPSFKTHGQQYYRHTDEEEKLEYSIDFGARGEKPITKEEQQYFKLKVTLTPLGWASNNIEIKTINYLKAKFHERADGTKYNWSYDRYKWMYQEDTWQTKEYKGEKIEFIIQIPLYGGANGTGSGKTIMIADLQRLRNYHIKIESLENVKLPKDVETNFSINPFSMLR